MKKILILSLFVMLSLGHGVFADQYADDQRVAAAYAASQKLNSDLHQAVASNNIEKATQLVKEGANVNSPGIFGSDTKGSETPLYYAVRTNSKDMVRVLVEQGADINMPINGDGGYGSKPIHAAANSIEMIQVLIDLGVDVDGKDRNGRTLLHYVNGSAVYKNTPDIIKLLVSAKANINCRDDRGWTPLHGNNSIKNITALIDAAANINIKDIKGQTPLHLAVQVKDNDVVIKLLLDSKANVNSADNEGKTPLHLIAGTNNHAMDTIDSVAYAQLLIKFGADRNKKDNKEKIPYEYAITEEMRDLLRPLSQTNQS